MAPPKKSLKESAVEEEYVTVNVETEMLETQKILHDGSPGKETLTFLQLFMETTNKWVDDLLKAFTEYKQFGLHTSAGG